MKLRVYLDTSVFSARYDERLTDRQAATEDFWARSAEFDLATSRVAQEELAQTPDAALRDRLGNLVAEMTCHAVTEEMRELASAYVEAGIFTRATLNDAIHVAAAVLTHQDVLLSWNFRHLVNRRRRAQVNQVNMSLGFPTIEILAPPEI